MSSVFVTQDAGNSDMMAHIARVARKREHEHVIDTFLGMGMSLADQRAEIEKAIKNASCLLVSLSSKPENVLDEIFAMKTAYANNVRFGIASDVPGMIHRSLWCGDAARNAAFLTVTSESEITSARKYVSTNTQIFAVRNPNVITYFTPAAVRDEVRAKLGVGEDEVMILGAGSKEDDRNEALIRDILLACNKLDVPIRIFFTLHPMAGQKGDTYAELITGSKHLATFDTAGLKTDALLEGADIFMTAGGSTTGIRAACRRIPSIDLIHVPRDTVWWEGISGLDYWPLNRMGASALARNSEDLAGAITEFIDPANPATTAMRAAQEEHFKPEYFENAADEIIKLITG